MSILPKEWKTEHVIACLVREVLLIDHNVIQSELDWMAKTSEDYLAEGIDVPGVWDDVDDIMVNLANSDPLTYRSTVEDSIDYVTDNFDDDQKNKLIGYLSNMAAQDDVVEYSEYLILKNMMDKWFPGSIEILVNDIKKSGTKVVTKSEIDSESGDELPTETDEWTIIHDLAVFYNYMANLADGMMKEDEMKIIRDIMPKWKFIIDDKSYGISIGNPENLEETMNAIYDEMYGSDGKGDPMGRVNQSQKNLVDYYNKGGILNANIIGTFLNTMFQVCKADDTISEGQAHQLSYYCNQWLPACPNAQKTLVLLDLENQRQKMKDDLIEAGVPEDSLPKTKIDPETGKMKVFHDEEETPTEVKTKEAEDDPVESFRNFMASQVDGLKLPKGKPYGVCPIGNGIELDFYVKKNCVATYMYSNGKVKAESLIKKIHDSGIAGKVLNDKYILEPMPGKRNPEVVRIDINILYEGRELNSEEMRDEVKDIYGQMLSLCKNLV